MWAEWISNDMTTKIAIVEKNNGIIRYQMETTMDGMDFVSQIWYDENTKEVNKYVSKTNDMVICFEGDQTEMPNPEGDEQYVGQIPELGYGTYTTPTGKTVSVAKFESSEGEYWISDKVPFGLVKISLGKEDQLILNDFGMSGAINKITDMDIANCQDLNAMIPQ